MIAKRRCVSIWALKSPAPISLQGTCQGSMTVRERPEAALPHRFRKEAQPEDRLAGFVGDFYLPLRVIFQIASKIPRQVGRHAPASLRAASSSGKSVGALGRDSPPFLILDEYRGTASGQELFRVVVPPRTLLWRSHHLFPREVPEGRSRRRRPPWHQLLIGGMVFVLASAVHFPFAFCPSLCKRARGS